MSTKLPVPRARACQLIWILLGYASFNANPGFLVAATHEGSVIGRNEMISMSQEEFEVSINTNMTESDDNENIEESLVEFRNKVVLGGEVHPNLLTTKRTKSSED